MSDQVANTDYSKHTEAELRDGINKADETLSQGGSDGQREAAQAQRDAMQAELDKRQS